MWLQLIFFFIETFYIEIERCVTTQIKYRRNSKLLLRWKCCCCRVVAVDRLELKLFIKYWDSLPATKPLGTYTKGKNGFEAWKRNTQTHHHILFPFLSLKFYSNKPTHKKHFPIEVYFVSMYALIGWLHVYCSIIKLLFWMF